MLIYVFGGIYLLLPLSYFWSLFLAACVFYWCFGKVFRVRNVSSN